MLKNLLLGVALVGMPVAAGAQGYLDAFPHDTPDAPYFKRIECTTPSCIIMLPFHGPMSKIKRGVWEAPPGCFYMVVTSEGFGPGSDIVNAYGRHGQFAVVDCPAPIRGPSVYGRYP